MVIPALARMTFSHAIRQPVWWLTIAIGIVLMGLSWVFGMFNFEDADRLRLLVTSGVAVVALSGVFLGVMLCSQAIYDELASRTALTLFAKPVSRADFLLGRVFGVWVALALAMLVLVAAWNHAGNYGKPWAHGVWPCAC